MINLPDKNSSAKIIGVVTEPLPFVKYSKSSMTFAIVIYKEDPTETSKYEITQFDAATPQGMADQIANAIHEARDIGFEQGRRYVREALGIKE